MINIISNDSIPNDVALLISEHAKNEVTRRHKKIELLLLEYVKDNLTLICDTAGEPLRFEQKEVEGES